jgi:Fic-DOC domain mobile mystery protein B
MNFEYPEGATPLEREEAEGLLLSHISTRKELDRFEQENIIEAEKWAFKGRKKDSLTVDFFLRLHKKMFGSVWRWAGQFRTSDKNIGVPVWQISTELKKLCDDVAFWIGNATYPPDEIAARFHHRLTMIHPFPNGNGRHARLMTDILLEKVLGQPHFTWGSGNLTDAGDCRKQYIDALYAADQRDFGPLLAFVRS